MKTITTSAHTPTEIRVEKVSENVAKIIAYPFETGYAVTVAHPLKDFYIQVVLVLHQQVLKLVAWHTSLIALPECLKMLLFLL